MLSLAGYARGGYAVYCRNEHRNGRYAEHEFEDIFLIAASDPVNKGIEEMRLIPG